MKDKYQKQWEKLGQSDPYWAVLTDPDKKGNKWKSSEFFQSGEAEVANVLLKLDKLGIAINFNVALDFGCGTGRLSRALANRFSKVIAIDISSSMLNEARRANQQFENIDFLHNTVEDLALVSSDSVDFLYSNIVLQHMPRNRQIVFIQEFCRVLKPGGTLVFQTPSSHNLASLRGWVLWLAGNNVLNMARKIKYGSEGVMELHTLAQKNVLETLGREGVGLVEAERYDSAGATFKSYMYYGVKR